MIVDFNYYGIDAGTTFQGLLKTEIVYSFNDFLVRIILYRFKSTDVNILNTIYSEIKNNPKHQNINKKIELNIHSDIYLKKDECDEFLTNNLSKNLAFFNNNKTEKNKLINWKILDKINFVMTLENMIELYKFLFKFNTSYDLLLNLYNICNNKIKNKEEVKDIKITEQIKVKEEPISEIKIDNTTNNLTNIIDLCINNVVKTHVIHHVYTFFNMFSHKLDNIYNDNVFNIPILFDKFLILNNDYIKSIILSLRSYNIEETNFYVNKLLNILKSADKNKLSNLEILTAVYLLFIYSLKFLQESHYEHFMRMDEITSSGDIQIKIINHILSSRFKENFVNIKYNDVNIDDIIEIENNNIITDISEKYKHILSISEEDFIDKVLFDYNNIENDFPADFKFKNVEILDLVLIKNNINNSLDNTGNIFNYDFTNKFLTKEYEYFIKYLENPQIILTLDDNIIKKEIKFNFENLKNILTHINFNKDNINTLSYYMILCDKIPTLKEFPHSIIMLIIYKIIIPYYYDIYKVTKFQDYLI